MRTIIQFIRDRPKIIVLIFIGLIWVFMKLATVLGDTIGIKPVIPQITVKDASPCLYENGRWLLVESLNMGDGQYICADLESNTYPIQITLLIYKENRILASHVITNELTEENISFQVFLEPGQYRAKLMYVRTVLAEFNFDVIGK